MKVLSINNDGAGFADYVEIPAGTTVKQFFAEQVPARQAAGLSDPRQPSAGRLRPGLAGGGPRELHPLCGAFDYVA